MALRIRADGRVLCAAHHPEQLGDAYLDDGVHYALAVERRVLVTEPMPQHAEHGEWWWKGQEPLGVDMDSFYYEDATEPREQLLADALTRVLEWPLPRGTVEEWALPRWLAELARTALKEAV